MYWKGSQREVYWVAGMKKEDVVLLLSTVHKLQGELTDFL